MTVMPRTVQRCAMARAILPKASSPNRLTVDAAHGLGHRLGSGETILAKSPVHPGDFLGAVEHQHQSVVGDFGDTEIGIVADLHAELGGCIQVNRVNAHPRTQDSLELGRASKDLASIVFGKAERHVSALQRLDER